MWSAPLNEYVYLIYMYAADDIYMYAVDDIYMYMYAADDIYSIYANLRDITIEA